MGSFAPDSEWGGSHGRFCHNGQMNIVYADGHGTNHDRNRALSLSDQGYARLRGDQ